MVSPLKTLYFLREVFKFYVSYFQALPGAEWLHCDSDSLSLPTSVLTLGGRFNSPWWWPYLLFHGLHGDHSLSWGSPAPNMVCKFLTFSFFLLLPRYLYRLFSVQNTTVGPLAWILFYRFTLAFKYSVSSAPLNHCLFLANFLGETLNQKRYITTVGDHKFSLLLKTLPFLIIMIEYVSTHSILSASDGWQLPYLLPQDPFQIQFSNSPLALFQFTKLLQFLYFS